MVLKLLSFGHHIEHCKWLCTKTQAVILNQKLSVGARNKRYLSTANEIKSGEMKAVECPNKWNRAIANAEKLLGYPNILMFTDVSMLRDLTPLIKEFRKLYGSSHPLLRVIMTLIYDGQNNIQSRGLIALLLAKMIGIPSEQELKSSDIIERQIHTATVMQLMYSAKQIHKSVTDVKKMHGDSVTYEELEHGNKLTILIGDLLLTKANLLFKDIKNTEVFGKMSTSLKDMMKGEFVYERDEQGIARPFKNTQLSDWELHSYLTNASILANGCKSMAILAQVDENKQDLAFEFGKQLGLAWQASDDLRQFVNVSGYPLEMQFSLVSCPVILQLEKDPDQLDFVYACSGNGNIANFKKIHEIVTADSTVINRAREICGKHINKALDMLREIPESTHKTHLKNIVSALRVDELSFKSL